MLSEFYLSFVDGLLSNDVDFIYLSETYCNGAKSWTDYVASPHFFSSMVTSVYTVCDGRNLSDHNLPCLFFESIYYGYLLSFYSPQTCLSALG